MQTLIIAVRLDSYITLGKSLHLSLVSSPCETRALDFVSADSLHQSWIQCPSTLKSEFVVIKPQRILCFQDSLIKGRSPRRDEVFPCPQLPCRPADLEKFTAGLGDQFLLTFQLPNYLHFSHFQIVLTEMYYDGFHRSFCDTDDLETVHESDCIFAFETPEIFRPEGILSQRGK